MNEEIKCGMHTYIYSEVLVSHLKKEILPFANMWMKLEGTMLSVISQTVKNKYSRIPHVESKNIQPYIETKRRLLVTGAGRWKK